jgi:hypothetical protein
VPSSADDYLQITRFRDSQGVGLTTWHAKRLLNPKVASAREISAVTGQQLETERQLEMWQYNLEHCCVPRSTNWQGTSSC